MITVTEVAALLSALALVATAIVTAMTAWKAVPTYRENAAQRRGEWIARLYEKFFENGRHRSIRLLLDSEPAMESHQEAFIEILGDPRGERYGGDAIRLEEDLTDYLNFFEFIALLVEKGLITVAEVRSLFGYYLARLGENADLMRYAAANGFEKLAPLIDKAAKRPE